MSDQDFLFFLTAGRKHHEHNSFSSRSELSIAPVGLLHSLQLKYRIFTVIFIFQLSSELFGFVEAV